MAKIELVKRDTSWLSFNHRVLQEAMDKSVPLYERIKFLAIYSSNIDEFYTNSPFITNFSVKRKRGIVIYQSQIVISGFLVHGAEV
ncbi:MAG: hypothetical protein HRU12_23930, partial [Phaeodactylibacter sp.]|nr:hypothetical protein [Phaeodactylibacter sp.]